MTRGPGWTRDLIALALLGAAAALTASTIAGCDDSSTTATSPTTTTTATVAEPTTTEVFAGRVDASGSTFYSFSVGVNGTVNVTLAAVGGANVPSTVWLGLGLGTPSGEDCSTTSAVNTAAGTSVQLTTTLAPGVYCVRVWDIGNLVATAGFNVTIAHP